MSKRSNIRDKTSQDINQNGRHFVMPFLLRSIALRPRCKVMACRVRASDVLLSCRNSASLKKHRMSWPTHKGPRSPCHYYGGALFPGLQQTTTQSCR